MRNHYAKHMQLYVILLRFKTFRKIIDESFSELMTDMSFDKAFFKYCIDNRSAISDTSRRTNVRASKTCAPELLSALTGRVR